MTKRNDGGTAFPIHPSMRASDNQRSAEGMSLRDWFAGQALAGLLTHDAPEDVADTAEAVTLAAVQAYDLADAMLRARGGE
jgi:hypothetical protein